MHIKAFSEMKGTKMKNDHYKMGDQRFVKFDANGMPVYRDYCSCGRPWICKKAPKKLRQP